MRTIRFAILFLGIVSIVGMAGAAVTASSTDPERIGAVFGTADVHQLSGGSFAVEDQVFQYRDYVVAGETLDVSDPRLAGWLRAAWNWDVQSSGRQPIPNWGTIVIDGADGDWTGQFTGIQRGDLEPIGIRALLFGDGAYEGMCATLDIIASQRAMTDTWVLDGVVHPATMTS